MRERRVDKQKKFGIDRRGTFVNVYTAPGIGRGGGGASFRKGGRRGGGKVWRLTVAGEGKGAAARILALGGGF